MKQYKSKSFILIPCLALSIIGSIHSENNNYYDASEGTPVDTSRCIFFLDGERASAMSTLYKMGDGSVSYQAGFGSPKDAIFTYGEKARHGILIFESVKKEKNDSVESK